MKIVADENIPLLQNYFGDNGELILKRGRDITRHDVKNADILLVRSVTRVDQKLLQDTPIQFVGSVTTGIDHLDVQWLNQQNIKWSTAYGCNATAVVEYVIAIIAALQKMRHLPTKPLRAGVIGVGNIGSQVVDKLKILGFDVVTNDPLRATTDKDFISTPLEQFHDLDFITLHTPLTVEDEFPTYHLIDKKFFQQQRHHCVLLNTGRGAVINCADILEYGKDLQWCLDVWEHEPNINSEILNKATLATPHIAGYSIQSKYRGVEMIYKAACERGIIMPREIVSVPFPEQILFCGGATLDWREVVLRIYDPRKTSVEMKAGNLPFDELRKNFNTRNEFGFVKIADVKTPAEDKNLLAKLGIVL